MKTLTLPEKPSRPKTNPLELSALLYSAPKFGKSTFCSGLPGALFLPTERGLDHLECFKVPADKPCLESWEELLHAAAMLRKGEHPFRAIVIDTIDNAYRLCSDHVCKKLGIAHQADLGFGKGFAMVNNEFIRVLNKLASLPYGLFLTSHCRAIEEETSTGKRVRYAPTLPGKARDYVLGLVDMVLYADLDGDKRVLRTQPSLDYEAGDRTGRLPPVLPLDPQAFLACFQEAGA